ncbi:MAG: hypothetical protein KA712_12120 [Myxococcales bacterium]|nr:hypothetical protein [Myxococcales bacterium]
MKYKTFRNLVLSGVVLFGGGLVYSWAARPNVPPSPPQLLDEQTAQGAAPRVEEPAEPVAETHEPPAVRFLLSTLGQPARSDKLKDALGRSGPKVNVYNEGGIWARAKVDLDRDDKWDEKWNVEAAGLKRRVSSADDDQTYDQEAFWHDGAWTGQAGAPSVQAAGKAPGAAADLAVLGLLKQPVKPTLKDAARGQPYKINLYSDGGTRWTRAKVDLDRDEKWDEKWTFKSDGRIEKQIAPTDDERYDQTLVRKGNVWVPK